MVIEQPASRTATVLLDGKTFEQPAARWFGAVVGLLDEQCELCGRLERLGAEQSGHVEAGRTEELLSVLSRRQEVLDRVVQINEILEPFRANRESVMSRLPASDREALQGRIDRIAETVDRVRRRDDEDRRRLEQQRKSVADELSGMTRLRGAAAAYASNAATASRFHDRHG
jgi:flagellar biosynthesis/type III secretory pathway chaperone